MILSTANVLKHVTDKYDAMVEWYWQGKNEYSWLRITASLLSVNHDSAFKHQENIMTKT